MNKIFIICCILLVSCRKVALSDNEVIQSMKLAPATIDADGTSQAEAIVKINSATDASKRKVIFEASAGTFAATSTKTVTVEAVYEAGELVARAKLKAPMSPGFVTVTAKPETRSAYNDIIIKDSIEAILSSPFSISVSASAFGVQTGYVGEVIVTGTLKNSKGKNVSTGVKVAFTDVYLNGVPVGGRFRQVQNSSDENSKVSVYY